MISDEILDWLFAPFEWLVGTLPVSTLDLSLPEGLLPVSALFANFIDVGAFSTATTLIVLTEGGILAFHVLFFIYRKFPVIGPG